MAKRAASGVQREWLDELAAYAAGLRDQIELECVGFAPGAEAATARRTRARADFGYFCRTYLPHYYQPDGREVPPSTLQAHLFARLPDLATNGAGDHDAIAAPRGETKSTTCALALPLWCIVYGLKRYPILFSDTYRQAAEQLAALQAELEANPRLKADFPQAVGRGRVWKEGVIVTAGNVKVQAFGAGQRVRGLRHGPHRPDLCILDDLENDENVRSPEQRDRLDAWLHRTVLPLGPPDGSMDVLYIGTVLHYDAVLARVLRSPLWSGRHFRSLIQVPDRMDLWEQWELVLREHGPSAARGFYEASRDAMEAGAVVSWPAVRPLYALMLIRAQNRDAFESEHQNEPVSGEANPFAEALQYWAQVPTGCELFGACDPSLGRLNRRGDPSALLVGAFHRPSGRLFVLEASVRRRTPDRIISDIIALQRQHHCRLWAVESVQFQEFLRTELVARSAAAGVPVPARGVLPHADKGLRIEALQPHCQNGLILLRPDQRELIEQLRHYPDADHDDGPDALAMLWDLCLAGSRHTYSPMRLLGL